MSGVAKAVDLRRNAPDRHYDRAVKTVLASAGALFSLVGTVLVIGGYLSFNGSAFHIFAGLGLILSGALVSRQHAAGAWTYMLVFAATVGWSLRNIQDGSMLAVRLIGPSLLLLVMAVLMPVLCSWRPKHTIAVFTLVIAGMVGLGISSLQNGPLADETAAVNRFLDAKAKGVLQ